jgi:uncharacterized membrane protein YwaF
MDVQVQVRYCSYVCVHRHCMCVCVCMSVRVRERVGKHECK